MPSSPVREVKKPPSRDIVMTIADYLACDLTERNRLLMTAHHDPIQPYRSGEALATFARVVRKVMRFVPLPAYTINRDWDVLDVNECLLALASITHAEYEAMPT